jgi:hypothetical protein
MSSFGGEVKRLSHVPALGHVKEHTLPAVLNRVQNSCCTVITDLGTSKRSIHKAFACCDAILETEKRTAGSARETWTVAAAGGVRCARER